MRFSRALVAYLATAACLTAAIGASRLEQTAAPAAIPSPQGTATENGLAGYAKILCSAVFVSGRTPEDGAQGSAYFFMPAAERDKVTWSVDRDARLVRTSLGTVSREARYYGDQGCIIQNPEQARHPLHAGRGDDDVAGCGDAGMADGRPAGHGAVSRRRRQSQDRRSGRGRVCRSSRANRGISRRPQGPDHRRALPGGHHARTRSSKAGRWARASRRRCSHCS